MADISKIKLPDGVTYDFKDNTKLPLAGGTMSGQIKTSFKSSVATGSYGANAHTIPDLCDELRYSSGVMGSFDLTTSYTKDGVTIPTRWYNFLWIPHRSGGINGQASGDNCDYGSLLLSAMTGNGLGVYALHYFNGNINTLEDLTKDTNTTYTFANGTNGFTVTPSGGSAQTVTVTPSIANNVTGSGTSGYIAKFNGGNTITNGPALGSSTTTFLRNDGQWATPAVGSDVNVTQTATDSTNANYEVLFSGTADNTTRTEGTRKSSKLTFNPYTGGLTLYRANNTSALMATGDYLAYMAENGSSNYSAVFISDDGIEVCNKDDVFNPPLKLMTGTGNVISKGDISATSLNGVTIGSSPKFTDTHRTVQIDSSEVLGDNTTPLNLVSGSGIQLAQWAGSSGSGIVINATNPPVQDISSQYTFHKTSGPWTVQDIRAVRSGNVVTMQLVIKGGSAVSAGSNGIVGTFSGGPFPAKVNGGTQDILAYGACFYGVSALVGILSSSGEFTLRLLINNQSLGSNTTSIGFTFVCD